MVSRPEITVEVTDGVCRLLYHQMVCLTELRLGNGRRLDVLALGAKGELWSVEVKSSVADFKADQKWESYVEYCDRLFFCRADGFSQGTDPRECGTNCRRPV